MVQKPSSYNKLFVLESFIRRNDFFFMENKGVIFMVYGDE